MTVVLVVSGFCQVRCLSRPPFRRYRERRRPVIEHNIVVLLLLFCCSIRRWRNGDCFPDAARNPDIEFNIGCYYHYKYGVTVPEKRFSPRGTTEAASQPSGNKWRKGPFYSQKLFVYAVTSERTCQIRAYSPEFFSSPSAQFSRNPDRMFSGGKF